MILPADKGDSTVILSKGQYASKLSEMLSKSTYRRLSKDPTKSQETKVTRMLKSIEKAGELNNLLYEQD